MDGAAHPQDAFCPRLAGQKIVTISVFLLSWSRKMRLLGSNYFNLGPVGLFCLNLSSPEMVSIHLRALELL